MRAWSVLSALSAITVIAACGEPREEPDTPDTLPEDPAVGTRNPGEPDPGVGYDEGGSEPESRTGERDTGDTDRRGRSSWHYRENPPAALYGPPQSEAIFMVSCRADAEGERRLVYTWHTAAEGGSTESLRFSGNGESAEIPVQATPMQLGPDFVWQGAVAPGDPSELVFRSGEGPVTLAVGGNTLAVPSEGTVERVYEECR